MSNYETTLTARNLRAALFHLADQKMTVEELHAMLFEVSDQDAPIEIGFSMWLKMEAKKDAADKAYAEFIAVNGKNPESLK